MQVDRHGRTVVNCLQRMLTKFVDSDGMFAFLESLGVQFGVSRKKQSENSTFEAFIIRDGIQRIRTRGRSPKVAIANAISEFIVLTSEKDFHCFLGTGEPKRIRYEQTASQQENQGEETLPN